MNELQSELKKFQEAKKDHAKLLRNQAGYERQLRTYQQELQDMKRTKVIHIFNFPLYIWNIIYIKESYCTAGKIVTVIVYSVIWGGVVVVVEEAMFLSFYLSIAFQIDFFFSILDIRACIYPTSPPQAGCDRLIFMWNNACFNSVSFCYAGFLTKAKESYLPYYLPIFMKGIPWASYSLFIEVWLGNSFSTFFLYQYYATII